MSESLRVSWIHGEKTQLAKRLGISPQYLGDIVHGRKRALPELAIKFVIEAKAMGLHLTRDDVMFPLESKNPLITCEL